MGKRVLLYWLCLLILKNATASVVWDFGTEVEGSSVVAQISGVSVGDKSTNITLPVPTCMEVKYVRVEVTNNLTTPEVTYNKDTHTVHISYELLQLSVSRYEVVAKGKRSQHSQCGAGKGARNDRRNGVGGGPDYTDINEQYEPGHHKKYPKVYLLPHRLPLGYLGMERNSKYYGGNGNGSRNRKCLNGLQVHKPLNVCIGDCSGAGAG